MRNFMNKQEEFKAIIIKNYNDMTYSGTPIINKDKKQVNSTESVQMIITQYVFADFLKSERIA